jgi:formylglycine-generating enzyme required for sulfatase activity
MRDPDCQEGGGGYDKTITMVYGNPGGAKMRAEAVFWLIFFFVIPIGAATVDLKGAVVNENGDSLAETLLFLKSDPAVRCSTDEYGTFHLSGGARAIVDRRIAGNDGIRVRRAGKGGGLTVGSSGIRGTVAVDIFNANGRRMGAARFNGSSPAEHFVSFPPSASGVHFIKVSTGNETIVFEMLPGLGGSSLAALEIPAGITRAGVVKRATPLVDTLVAYRYEYRTALVGLASRQGNDVLVTLRPSNTWENCSCAPLVKWHGMVKIIGKSYHNVDTCDFEMGQLCDTLWGIKEGKKTSDLEQPVHTVRFDHNYLMDTMEISQGEYDSVMKAAYASYVAPAKWTALYGRGNKYPAYAVSWDDAALFCNARSKRDHLDTAYTYTKIEGTPGSQSRLVGVNFQLFTNGYRLPTEAEWEYCGRAGMREDFWWSKNWQDYKGLETIDGVDGYAIWSRNSWNLGSGAPGYGTHPVDSSEEGVGGNAHNFFELKGMYGNVSEWCNDLVGPYEWGTFLNPTGPAWSSDTTRRHVIRGGNWGTTIMCLRGANRYFYAPAVDKDVFIGFRTVRAIGDEM